MRSRRGTWSSVGRPPGSGRSRAATASRPGSARPFGCTAPSSEPQTSRERYRMGMISEFKDFAMRGNVVDLAVGVVIGAAFGKIVTSLVNDVVMPVVGKLTGGVDFSSEVI